MTYNSIDGKQLITALQSTMTICDTTRNDSRYVNRRILLSAYTETLRELFSFMPKVHDKNTITSHHIESKAFISLGQLNNSLEILH